MTITLAVLEYGVLRSEPRLRPFDHVVELLVQYIDVSPSFSLAAAAARGSTSLLKHVARRLQNDSSTYDHDLLSHWVAQAMEQALRRDDLKMIQAIHDVHPESLDIRSLRLSIQFGTLKTVHWLVENRCDRQCCAPGVANLCASCVLPIHAERDAFEIVRWLIEEQVVRLGSGHTLTSTGLDKIAQTDGELTRWLDTNDFLSAQDRQQLLLTCLKNGMSESVDVVEYLANLPGTFGSEHELIEALLVLSVDPRRERLVEAIFLSHLCDSLRCNLAFAPYCDGGCNVLQWDAEFMEANPTISVTLQRSAGVYGHLGLLQWLWYERNVRCDFLGVDGLESEKDIRRLVEWVYQVHPTMRMWYLVNALARRGFVRLIEWTHKRKLHNEVFNLMDKAARFGYLDVVQWLHNAQIQEVCSPQAMNGAAANGHLHVVKWLHHNRHEGCTTKAMNRAAANGHLEVVRWLHANRKEACTEKALKMAIQNGHFEVVKFLVSTDIMPCNSWALGIAALHGRLEILAWLHDHGGYRGTAATVLCEITRGPSRFANKHRPQDLIARDTNCWLNARFSFQQHCHVGYCHFANYDEDLVVWAARVGDSALFQNLETCLMPNEFDSIEKAGAVAALTGHLAFVPHVQQRLDAYYNRYAT